MSDAPLAERSPQAEHDFAYGIGHWPMAHLQRSLHRELREELELSERDHYALGAAIDVAPYRRIEGPRNHHSYTEYRIRLFPLQLNMHGKLALFDRLHRCPELFAWFTPEELERENNTAGQQAFVTALVEHFGLGLKELVAVPPATTENYLFNDALIGIDIPLTPEQFVTSGRSGKSLTPCPARLTEAELQWLWALAWHAKSLPITGTNKIGLLPSGWMRVDDMAAIQSLRDKLEAKGLRVVEIEGGRYARLSVPPRMVYFDPGFFRYRLSGTNLKGRLELYSMEMHSPLGVLRQETTSFEFGATLAAELRHLDGIELLSDGAPNPPNLRRLLDDLMSDETKRIGLRQMVVRVDKDRKFRELLIKKDGDD
ncbi:hypothetical protein GTP91_25315 [Rugamonas sp. FT82W]|uniref:Uncharacterized protein n=1 Tax=Duganella vulcania TaxID=2692166 RepID=A0A845GCG4_9BURK|nr:hypothetical protein [Duganella vulcania]MYM90479.1 hypothetical protein [Duganella vulcania]